VNDQASSPLVLALTDALLEIERNRRQRVIDFFDRVGRLFGFEANGPDMEQAA
jgi:hypothetical protein